MGHCRAKGTGTKEAPFPDSAPLYFIILTIDPFFQVPGNYAIGITPNPTNRIQIPLPPGHLPRAC